MDPLITEVTQTIVEAYRHSRCVVMIPLPSGLADSMREFHKLIDQDDLYFDPEKEGKYGLETEPHVTVLYGIKEASKLVEVQDIAEGHDPFVIYFDKMSTFPGEGYEVLKIEIVSEGLHALHQDLRKNVENDYKWPDYLPHSTVAYLKPGRAKKYTDIPEDEQPMSGLSALVPELLFKDHDGNPYIVPLHQNDDLADFLTTEGSLPPIG